MYVHTYTYTQFKVRGIKSLNRCQFTSSTYESTDSQKPPRFFIVSPKQGKDRMVRLGDEQIGGRRLVFPLCFL